MMPAMKNLLFLLFAISSFSVFAQKLTVSIPANQVFELDYPGYDLYEAKLKNKSSLGIEVAVLSKSYGERKRSFGLNARSKAEIQVEKGNKLVFINNNSTTASISLLI